MCQKFKKKKLLTATEQHLKVPSLRKSGHESIKLLPQTIFQLIIYCMPGFQLITLGSQLCWC